MSGEPCGRYPYFGVPPARQPRPAANEPALTGKRVILSTPEGFVYDMRAVSEVHTDGQGNAIIDILSERNYYEAPCSGQAVRPTSWPAHLVWIE